MLLTVALATLLQDPGALPDHAVRRLEGHQDGVATVSWSPDGRHLLSASRDQTVVLWDAFTGKRVRVYEGHAGGVRAACFLPDGRQFVSCSEDKTIILWDTESGRQVRTFRGHTIGIRSLAVSPDGLQLLSGSGDRSIVQWDIATGEKLRTFPGQGGWVLSLAFSADGRRALSANLDRSLSLIDLEKGEQIRQLVGHTDNVWSVAFSPDNRKALTAGGDAIMNVWDVATGQLLHTFEGHERGIYSAAFSLDGRTVVSGSKDKTVAIWDLETGGRLRSFKGHAWEVTSVAFSPGGRFIASGSEDSTILLWHPNLEEAREAERWAKGWSSQPDEVRKKSLAILLSDLDRMNVNAFAQVREKMLAAREEGVGAIVAAFPPSTGVALAADRLEKLLVDLDHDEYAVRLAARKELRSAGRSIVTWIQGQLQKASGLSVEVRSALQTLLREARSTVMDLGDLGQVRAVLILIEMTQSPAAREALARYAQGPATSYPAALARKALMK